MVPQNECTSIAGLDAWDRVGVSCRLRAEALGFTLCLLLTIGPEERLTRRPRGGPRIRGPFHKLLRSAQVVSAH